MRRMEYERNLGVNWSAGRNGGYEGKIITSKRRGVLSKRRGVLSKRRGVLKVGWAP